MFFNTDIHKYSSIFIIFYILTIFIGHYVPESLKKFMMDISLLFYILKYRIEAIVPCWNEKMLYKSMLNTVRGTKYFQPDSHTPLYHTTIYHSSHLHQYFHFDMLFAKQKTSYYGKHIWQSCLGGIAWRHPSSWCSPL